MRTRLNYDSSYTKRILYLGLTAILLMMTVLSFTTITILNSSEQRIKTVVQDHNEKTHYIVKMRTAARERILSLEKMLILKDPIEVSDEIDNFTIKASDFLVAREGLLAMQLTQQEKDLLNNLYALVRKSGTSQKQTVELILAEKFDAARYKLLEEVIPIQDEVFVFMSEMVELQKRAAKKAIMDGEQESEQVIYFLLLFGLVSAIITVVISFYIIRYITTSEKAINLEKERAQTTLHSIGDAVITTDEFGKIEQVNDAAERMLDLNSEEAAGDDLGKYAAFVKIGMEEVRYEPIQEALDKKNVVASAGDSILLTVSGDKFGVEYTASPVYDRSNNLTGSVLVIKDVSQLRVLSDELAYHAKHDNLTGLLNRREIESLIGHTLSEHRRYSDAQACVCYLDLDQFKIINDTCGHTAGDELLKQIAKILDDVTRDSDFVARMGGDEFVVIVRHCDEAGALNTMERVLERLRTHNFCWDNKCFNTTASIGIVPVKVDVGNVQDLMSAADAACYVAKEEGRNRIYLYNDDDGKANHKQGEMEWVHKIKQAINEERFVLYYQTIKSLPDGNEFLHGEILLRLLDENDKPITPFAFIPAAERYNLMPEIDRYVIKNTFDLLNRYHDVPAVSGGLFSINLSAQSLCEDGFLEFVITQLSNFKLMPENISFEITETAMISNLTKAIGLINKLKERGCKFALDDFGSGLSSFGYLKNLPVDYLKIDGSFVKNINNEKLDFAMVSSVNQFGDILGIETIAEFVENEAIEKTLINIGVNYAQGYGIDMPGPLKDVLASETSKIDNKKRSN